MLARPILGLAVSYHVYLMLAKKELGPLRPSRWMRWFLNWRVWTPLANLSYSIYLFHIFIIFLFEFAVPFYKSPEQKAAEKEIFTNPDFKYPEGCPT
jgi:peptidoglycan/LPS O-acetylase OafA/YrhL